jgi:hypothetical protein
MMERLRECSSLKLLCVPAWMDQHSFRDPSAGTAGPYWVLANSHPSGCGSFITNREGWKVEQIKNTEKDCLVVKTWDELNARSGPTTVI